jgi:FkbM family methyltransferase
VGYRVWIVSFEPDPTAAAHLRKIARSDPRWIVEEIAISDRSGTQPFHVMADSEFSSLSSPAVKQDKIFESFNVVRGTVDVRTETLASAFERLRPELGFDRPFLKLDTQGYDTRIVAAARETMRRFVGLQSELSVRRIYDDSRDFREALELYESAGFVLTAFVPNNAGHFPVLVETDCIMIRADVAADLQERLDEERSGPEPRIATIPPRS